MLCGREAVSAGGDGGATMMSAVLMQLPESSRLQLGPSVQCARRRGMSMSRDRYVEDEKQKYGVSAAVWKGQVCLCATPGKVAFREVLAVVDHLNPVT